MQFFPTICSYLVKPQAPPTFYLSEEFRDTIFSNTCLIIWYIDFVVTTYIWKLYVCLCFYLSVYSFHCVHWIYLYFCVIFSFSILTLSMEVWSAPAITWYTKWNMYVVNNAFFYYRKWHIEEIEIIITQIHIFVHV